MFMRWILLLLSVFTFGTTYDLYSTVDRWTGTKHDCIYSFIDPQFFQNFIFQSGRTQHKPKEEIIQFCLTVEHFTVHEEACAANSGIVWNFEQLQRKNVTGTDLMNWNAAVDIIDEYERHLQHNDNESNTFRFCNCSDRFHFGRECQYTFDLMDKPLNTMLESHFSQLQLIDDNEVGIMKEADISCYKRDQSCYGGCLDWRQICNGIVDCNDSQDEVSCELLEFNQCLDDEYRCRSGHCIPLMFAFDKSFDCADGSDEDASFTITLESKRCYRKVPNMFCDDFNNASMMFPCGDGESTDSPFYDCSNRRNSRILQQLYTDNATLCWQHLVCTQYLDYLFPLLVNCTALCSKRRECSTLLSSVCHDEMIIFPPKPIMFSPSVYLAYRRNKSEHDSPDFVCYSQCNHLYSPSLQHHGHPCLSMRELRNVTLALNLLLRDTIIDILRLFSGCIDKMKTSEDSLIFRCPIERRPISYNRIKDGFNDCHLGLDESFNGSSCTPNSTQQFRCWASPDECISRRFLQDLTAHCSDRSDEFYPTKCLHGTESMCAYQRGLRQPTYIQYQFYELCNGEEYRPSLFWLLKGTDETDCEDFWCLSVASTRCNGYWDCIDGRDELNCSLNALPTNAKSTKLLHTLNGCDVTEHFCMHVSNRSRDLSRSCISALYAGDGHVDCLGATDERHSICEYKKTSSRNRHVYRCAGKGNVCVRVTDICDGTEECPMGDDEKLCHWLPSQVFRHHFHCRNGTYFSRNQVQCNGKFDCLDGEDEWFCDLNIVASVITRFENINIPPYPISVQNNSIQPVHHIQAHTLAISYVKSSWYCNRGLPIADGRLRRCLCPPSYSGERCEYQRERISVILQIVSPPLLQRDIAIKFVLYLIDATSLDVLAEEEILHLPYVHSLYKHLISLPSDRTNNSFVRIDAYQVSVQQVIAYRASWKFTLPFPFLPVRRLAAILDLSNERNFVSRPKIHCHPCVHGQCVAYQNFADTFCRCYNGWTGHNCNESFICSSTAASLSSHRCLCPMNRHGVHCFVPNQVICQCQNGATCIPLDARTEQSACLCLEKYFGQYCEQQHASLTIRIFDEHQPEILPIVLFQFVDAISFTGIEFENTVLFERVSTRHPLVVYNINHERLPLMVLSKVFYSSSVDDYQYYFVLYISSHIIAEDSHPKHVQTQLERKQQCPHVRTIEVFKSAVNILAYPYIKRIKFYLRACADNTMICFHDEVYLCLCPIQKNQTATCVIYDHTREVCQKSSYCLNGGLCIQNQRSGIVEFACVCPSCHYYGALCQFSVGQQGLSLDALVGIEMRTGKTLSEQSLLIKLCVAILTIMITLGLIGNILSIATFARNKSRQTGSGYYLFFVSVCNQLALILLGLRFAYLLITQIEVWDNRARSLILCQCLEYGLTLLSNLSNWLSACVSVERAFTVIRGAFFDKKTSVRMAKRFCIVVLIVVAGMAVHQPLTRDLIEDPRLGRYTWCVAKFNAVKWRTLASALSIAHLLGPFLVNLLSTGILIVTITRQKLTVRKDKIQRPFTRILHEQIAYYKHLIISPTVLLILALPRLVISLGSLCIDTSWRNYVFLAGYFISFLPFMATLLIFILPAPVYRDELQVYLSRIRSH